MNTLHHKSDAFYKNDKGSSAQQKINNLFYVQIVHKNESALYLSPFYGQTN